MPQYDFMNPFGGTGVADPFGDPFARRRQPAVVTPLTPQEQESALARLGDAALGGLGWLGETLDKSFGGRTVRGILGGKGVGESLAHLMPFSDTLGITNPDEAVSGKELLGYGKEDDSWEGFGAGMAAEILLDPGTYLSFGGKALTKLGKAARKANVLPGELASRARGLTAGSQEAATLAARLGVPEAEVVGKALGGAAHFGIPGLMDTVIGGEKLAGAADVAKDYLTYTKPVRMVAPMFDSSLHQFGPAPYSEVGQRETRRRAAELAKAEAGVKIGHFEEAKKLRDAGLDKDPAALRQVVEGVQPASHQTLDEVAQGMRGHLDTASEAYKDYGVPVGEWQSEHGVKYSPRQATEDAGLKATKAINKRFGIAINPNDLSRIKELDVPGGTEAINQILKDPMSVGKGGADYVKTKIGYDAVEHQRLQQLKPPERIDVPNTNPVGHNPPPTISVPNPDYLKLQQLNRLSASGDALAGMAAKLPDEFRANQLDYFGNSPLGDTTTYRLEHERKMGGVKGFFDIAAKTATSQYEPGAKSLADIFEGARFKHGTDAATGAERGWKTQMLDRLQKSGVLPAGSKTDDLANVFVPPEIAADLTRYGQSFATPEALKPILNLWDKVTNLTKTGQTVIWPAFHARNKMSAMWQNFVGGAYGKNPLGAEMDALALRGGKTLQDANKIPGFTHLSPEDATTKIRELAYAHGVAVPAERSLTNELLGKAPQETTPGELASFAGRKDKSGVTSLREMLPEWMGGDASGNAASQVADQHAWYDPRRAGRWNPLDAENFAPAKAGREISHATDDTSRLAGFLGYLRQGYDPEMAATRIKGLHWSGAASDLTPTEREFFRRVIPFYSFSRQNLPFQLQEILQNPGGLTGQALRASGEMRQQEGFLPFWLGEGMAIPLGSRENGNQRYLSSLGLPFEDLTKLVSTGDRPMQRTAQELLGQLNPMLKGPLEWATGMQFYSGRQLDDLYARTGDPITDQIVANSPIGRIARLASTIADPRKGPVSAAVNFVSPFRITDVNMDQAALTRERQLLQEQLAGNQQVRQFTNFFLDPAQAATVDPQTLEQLRLYRTLLDQAKARTQGAQR